MLSLHIVGELTMIFVRSHNCCPGPFNIFCQKFEHEMHCCKICVEPAEKQPENTVLLKDQAREDANFISKIITNNEYWVNGYDSEIKQKSSQ